MENLKYFLKEVFIPGYKFSKMRKIVLMENKILFNRIKKLNTSVEFLIAESKVEFKDEFYNQDFFGDEWRYKIFTNKKSRLFNWIPLFLSPYEIPVLDKLISENEEKMAEVFYGIETRIKIEDREILLMPNTLLAKKLRDLYSGRKRIKRLRTIEKLILS